MLIKHVFTILAISLELTVLLVSRIFFEFVPPPVTDHVSLHSKSLCKNNNNKFGFQIKGHVIVINTNTSLKFERTSEGLYSLVE